MICTWLQCDRCQKWRIVPDNTGGDDNTLWYCEMNPDHRHNRCDVPQQPDDAVVDFTGLLGSSARANRMRDVGEGSSSRDTKHTNGVDGEKEEKERKPTKPPPVPGRGRGRPPGSGNANSNGKRRPLLPRRRHGGGGWRSERGGRCRTCGGCGGAASPAERGGAPPRKRSSPGGPRAKVPKVDTGLKRAHPPASAFAATVAAHAAQTASSRRRAALYRTGRPAALCVC